MAGGSLLAVLLVVACAAATQRVTGLGFALVSGPLLALVAGPREGVVLANALSLAANLIVLAQTWRDVEPRRVAALALPAVCMVPVGAWVAGLLPAGLLMMGIGGLVFGAILLVAALRGRPLLRGTGGAVSAGALSGFMNVTAGVGGPAMTLYALGSAWEHRRFVGSMQLYFAVVNAASVLAKGWPALPVGQVVAILAALLAGSAAGVLAARQVPAALARRAVTLLALAGSGATVVKGWMLA